MTIQTGIPRWLVAWCGVAATSIGTAACGAGAPGGGGGPSPSPVPSVAPRPAATPAVPGPASMVSARWIQPKATPAPGGGPTSYPEGTVFTTGTVTVTIGAGGHFIPDHLYLRPGTITLIVNRDSVPHTFVGFNGATDASGPIPPGGTTSHQWEHPGTWTFHDTLTADSPVFTVTDVPDL